MANKWFVPRRTCEIALENAKKINEQRIKVAQENRELQIKVIDLENTISELKKEIKKLKTIITKSKNAQKKGAK